MKKSDDYIKKTLFGKDVRICVSFYRVLPRETKNQVEEMTYSEFENNKELLFVFFSITKNYSFHLLN